ncbi:hypothetical protein TanjilG_26261 [Lupinus angustifolius]|uniref:VOC domain-containing protein n=1 Tax=Lupinus angustifolius TaxID=3871 RepID=A0A4P1R2X9_LUPAN|nr:PREDICTED: uncharacterized protein LOC109362019 [Lupinus angustifolius]OIV99923.1 hypothetical protein TanjilG_26261 [Lupinus angustifolius]
MGNPLQLKSLNHISLVCGSVEKSIDFYVNVLGFIPIKRPTSLDFNGAWLFNYGIGIHLLQSEDPKSMPKNVHINPKDNHISFQCESIAEVERRLKQMNINYVKNKVEENGINVDQLFFHDPDGWMIEICNCDNIPVVPLSEDNNVRSCSRFNCNIQNYQQQIQQMISMYNEGQLKLNR